MSAGIPWWVAEPRRLERDKTDMLEHFPTLTLDLTGHGNWTGQLPAWPFERDAPDGLETLLSGGGLHVIVEYTPAYPAVFPFVRPTDPVPEFETWTQARWHVLGNGALCQFQTYADWDPAAPVTDLLYRAAAWYVEYELLRSGVIEEMSVQGIWHHDSLDYLVADAVEALTKTPANPEPTGEDDMADGVADDVPDRPETS